LSAVVVNISRIHNICKGHLNTLADVIHGDDDTIERSN